MDTAEPAEAAASGEADADDDVDPLDAFMRQINTEIRGARPGAAGVSYIFSKIYAIDNET